MDKRLIISKYYPPYHRYMIGIDSSVIRIFAKKWGCNYNGLKNNMRCKLSSD